MKYLVVRLNSCVVLFIKIQKWLLSSIQNAKLSWNGWVRDLTSQLLTGSIILKYFEHTWTWLSSYIYLNCVWIFLFSFYVCLASYKNNLNQSIFVLLPIYHFKEHLAWLGMLDHVHLKCQDELGSPINVQRTTYKKICLS